MGGTVAGIAYLGEKKFRWAVQHPQKCKTLIIAVGMPVAYLLVTNLTRFVVIVELSFLFVIAYFFFVKQSHQNGAGGSKNLTDGQGRISKIEEQMEQCC